MSKRRRFKPVTILGPRVDWRDLASTVQAKHTPQDRRQFRLAAHGLASRGMGVNDIAARLHLSPPGVRELLAEPVPTIQTDKKDTKPFHRPPNQTDNGW